MRRIPRASALTTAKIARRLGQYSMALNILNPVVRPRQPSSVPASPLEQIEYGKVLREAGAIQEAREIFEHLDEGKYPQTLLLRALCYISHWRHAQAVPLLKAYLQAKSITGYNNLVGRLNLAAALVYERMTSEAHETLADLRHETRKGGFSLLLGHTLELSAQLEISEFNWKKANDYLDQGAACLVNAGAANQPWLQKWRSIAQSLEQNQVTPELLGVLKTAQDTFQWETVRDCSFYIARIQRNADLMNQVYFGTPHDSYRKNILKVTADWYQPAEHYVISANNAPATIVDAATGVTADSTEIVPFGQVHHRLLILLAKDLFKPLPLVAAFAHLFPAEHFNPLSSPTRIHQTVNDCGPACARPA